MTRASLLKLTAERALAAGRPLDQALTEVLGPLGGPTPEERTAISLAAQGMLERCLRTLGFSPVAAAAMRFNPRAAVRIGDRLRALPDTRALRTQLATPLWYFVTGLIVQAVILHVFVRYIAPVMQQISAGYREVLPWWTRVLIEWGHGPTLLLLTVGGIVLAVVYARRLAPSSLWQYEAASVCSAAAPLLNSGARVEEIFPLLLSSVQHRQEVESRLGFGVLNADAVDSLTQTLSFEFTERVRRLRTQVRVGGTVLLFALALALMVALYGTLPTIGLGLTQ